MAIKKIKAGDILVMDKDIFNEDKTIILISGTKDLVTGYNPKHGTLVSVSKEDVRKKVRKQDWYFRVQYEI